VQDIFQDINKQARLLLVPKAYFAWQTLLLLSLFSLFVAAALESIAGNDFIGIRVLTTLSWIFFISAVWWSLSEAKNLKVYGFRIDPWITGFVLCLFLFHPWRSDLRLRWAITSWPLISTGVMALPHFVNWELKTSLPNDKVKKTLITTLIVNLLLSSWIAFHFRIQDWLRDYPSLAVRGFDESEFVHDFTASDRQQPSQGAALLETMTSEISQALTDQPWYQTERWLYTRQTQLEAIFQRALETLDSPAESVFWRLDVAEPRRSGEGYALDLRANWVGPASREGVFYLEKSCKILPVEKPRPRVPQTGGTQTDRTQTNSAQTNSTQADEPQPIARLTSVSCGEDSPTEKFIGPDAAVVSPI